MLDSVCLCTYQCRGLTRNPNSEKGEALRQRDVEVVTADLNDKNSLVKAFSGADGVFVLTNFFESFSVEVEAQQGKNQIDAAKEAGVSHVVLSTLEGVTKVVGDRMKKLKDGWVCAHFDSKDLITDYAKASGMNVTYLYTSTYVSRFCIEMFAAR
jgi:NhaP-type Na+/H+ and K+/H+ antiporter